MSNLASIAGNSATSVAAQSNQGVTPRTDGNSAANNAAINNSAGQAAVVSLSASSQNRAASRGDARQVDAAFEKQTSKDISKEEKKKEGTGEDSKKVDISA